MGILDLYLFIGFINSVICVLTNLFSILKYTFYSLKLDDKSLSEVDLYFFPMIKVHSDRENNEWYVIVIAHIIYSILGFLLLPIIWPAIFILICNSIINKHRKKHF